MSLGGALKAKIDVTRDQCRYVESPKQLLPSKDCEIKTKKKTYITSCSVNLDLTQAHVKSIIVASLLAPDGQGA